MSNTSRGKFLKKGNTQRVPRLNRGPLVRPNVDALQNLTNLREPEQDNSSHNGQSIGQMNFVVPKYQLVQAPMLPSVSYSVLFSWVMVIYRVIIERALTNSDRLAWVNLPSAHRPVFREPLIKILSHIYGFKA